MVLSFFRGRYYNVLAYIFIWNKKWVHSPWYLYVCCRASAAAIQTKSEPWPFCELYVSPGNTWYYELRSRI